MFLDQEMKSIQKSKESLAICCDLRRHLIHIDIQQIWGGVGQTFSNLTLALSVVEDIFTFLRKRKGRRR